MRRLVCLLLLAAGARGDDAEALSRDTEALLAEIEAEVGARREGGRGDETDALAAEVEALRVRARGGVQPMASTVPEAHVVRMGERRRIWGGEETVSVRVTAIGRPLVLVLLGGHPAQWEVEVARGADVRRVLTVGAGQSVRGVRARVEAIDDLTLAEDADPDEVGSAVEACVGTRVTTVLDWVMWEEEAVCVGPENIRWQAQHVHREALDLYWRATRARRAAAREELGKTRFDALYHWKEGRGLRASFGAWTPLGPLLARQHRLPDLLAAASVAVMDEERGEIYLLRERVLVRFALPKGPPDVLLLPDTLPQASGRCALAIDRQRRRLLLAARHEEGRLYALDLRSRTWSVLNSLDGVDPAGMAYDAQRDAVLCVAFAGDGTLRLHRFSAEDGAHADSAPLRVPPLPEERPLAAACVEGRLVLLYPPPAERSHRAGEETRAFVVEPHSGQVVFATRVRPWEDFEPLPEARLEGHWNDLIARDEDIALRAMRSLAGQGDAAVRFLAKRFAPDPRAAEELGRWVAMLSDDDAFSRDLAQQRLVENGTQAEEFLARLDLATLPPEARRRVTAALEAVAGPERRRRGMRAVRVLEWIETPLADALLRDLVGKGDVGRSSAAREALHRIDGPGRR